MCESRVEKQKFGFLKNEIFYQNQTFINRHRNEKKLVLVLKKVKEENQTLQRNLKKMLAKPNIETKMMLENPAYSKFLTKMRARKKRSGYTNNIDNQKQELEKKIKEEEGVIDTNFE